LLSGESSSLSVHGVYCGVSRRLNDLSIEPGEDHTGIKKNWIPTIPGKGWFTYFRLYAPTEPYFDRSWKLADIERVE
jgi:hypothetical protein